MRTHDRQDKLTITNYLRMAKNAIMNVVASDGSVSEVSTTELAVLDGITATTAEINANCDVLVEAVTATNVILAAETGTHFILNTATAFVSTLPAVAAGLEFWFHIGATEPTTTHTVVTNGSDNVIVGNLATPDIDGASDVVTAADSDTISFVASKALHGDYAHVWCDGTNWYLDGMCKAFDGMTTSQVS